MAKDVDTTTLGGRRDWSFTAILYNILVQLLYIVLLADKKVLPPSMQCYTLSVSYLLVTFTFTVLLQSVLLQYILLLLLFRTLPLQQSAILYTSCFGTNL
jgi:hypothetical protein